MLQNVCNGNHSASGEDEKQEIFKRKHVWKIYNDHRNMLLISILIATSYQAKHNLIKHENALYWQCHFQFSPRSRCAPQNWPKHITRALNPWLVSGLMPWSYCSLATSHGYGCVFSMLSISTPSSNDHLRHTRVHTMHSQWYKQQDKL